MVGDAVWYAVVAAGLVAVAFAIWVTVVVLGLRDRVAALEDAERKRTAEEQVRIAHVRTRAAAIRARVPRRP